MAAAAEQLAGGRIGLGVEEVPATGGWTKSLYTYDARARERVPVLKIFRSKALRFICKYFRMLETVSRNSPCSVALVVLAPVGTPPSRDNQAREGHNPFRAVSPVTGLKHCHQPDHSMGSM
jgi:hypothetical protein